MIDFTGSYKSETFTLEAGQSRVFEFENAVGSERVLVFGYRQEKNRAPQVQEKDRVRFSCAGEVSFRLVDVAVGDRFAVEVSNQHKGRTYDLRLRVYGDE